MINEDKAFRMFCEKYVEKHKGQSMEVGGYGSCSFKELHNDYYYT